MTKIASREHSVLFTARESLGDSKLLLLELSDVILSYPSDCVKDFIRNWNGMMAITYLTQRFGNKLS